jgi:hypothetical protein
MDMFLPDVLRLRPNHSRHLWRCLDSVADDAGQSLEIECTGMCPVRRRLNLGKREKTSGCSRVVPYCPVLRRWAGRSWIHGFSRRIHYRYRHLL